MLSVTFTSKQTFECTTRRNEWFVEFQTTYKTIVLQESDTKQMKVSIRKTHTSSDCAQVIVRRCYLTHLQQEKCRYSICTKQIFKAAQFIRANYWYEVEEVIFLCYMLLSLGHRPSALVWIRRCLHGCTMALLVQLGDWVVWAFPPCPAALGAVQVQRNFSGILIPDQFRDEKLLGEGEVLIREK